MFYNNDLEYIQDHVLATIPLMRGSWSIRFIMNLSKPVTRGSTERGIKLFNLEMPNGSSLSLQLYQGKINVSYHTMRGRQYSATYWNNSMNIESISVVINQTYNGNGQVKMSTMKMNNEIVMNVTEYFYPYTHAESVKAITTAYVGEGQTIAIIDDFDFLSIPDGKNLAFFLYF